MKITPIGYIHTDFKQKFGLPRQSGRAPALEGIITLLPEYGMPEAIRGIEAFTHLWLIFEFSETKGKWNPTVRPPRLGGNTRLGVFATRSPFRPNSLGLTCVKIEEIDFSNNIVKLRVSGVDLMDGTPIYDIKPYIPYADCHPEAAGGFAEEHKNDLLNVNISDGLLEIIPLEKQQALLQCLADDPRPTYQNDPERIYKMSYAGFDIHFKVKNDVVTVINIVTLQN